MSTQDVTVRSLLTGNVLAGPFPAPSREQAATATAGAAIADAVLLEPWVLCASPSSVGLAADIAALVLSGEVAAFGLAGAVLLGNGTDGAVLRGLGLQSECASDPDDVPAAVARLRARLAPVSVVVPPDWVRVIVSSRLDPGVRGILADRALPDDPAYEPEVLSRSQLAFLRTLADRIVPQGGPGTIDLAARVDRMLAEGEGDGWRPAGAVSDAEAYRAGLDALAAHWPDDVDLQDALIDAAMDDGVDSPAIDAAHLTAWFEDARNDLVRAWLSHPASLARVGYTGFATGGTGPEPAGYLVLAAGEREQWEPEALGRVAADEAAA